MMATTHALWGIALGASLATLAPEAAPLTVVAGFLGGVLPDIDVYANHRRTLHAPVYGSVLAAVAVAFAVAVPAGLTLAVAALLSGAAVHAVMDAAGGGLSLRPWADQPDRAVYSHYHDGWVHPRRYVRYDGAPEDLLVACLVAFPLLALLDGYFRVGVAVLLACSAGYVLVRRRLVDILRAVVRNTPESLSVFVPRRLDHLDD